MGSMARFPRVRPREPSHTTHRAATAPETKVQSRFLNLLYLDMHLLRYACIVTYFWGTLCCGSAYIKGVSWVCKIKGLVPLLRGVGGVDAAVTKVWAVEKHVALESNSDVFATQPAALCLSRPFRMVSEKYTSSAYPCTVKPCVLRCSYSHETILVEMS